MISLIDDNSNNNLNLVWNRIPFRVENDFMVETEGPTEEYYPLDPYINGTETPAYLEFISVNPSDIGEITRFTKKYGFICYEDDSPKFDCKGFLENEMPAFEIIANVMDSAKTSTDKDLFKKIPLKEALQAVMRKYEPTRTMSIKRFKDELIKMRYIYIAYEALTSDNREELKEASFVIAAIDEDTHKVFSKLGDEIFSKFTEISKIQIFYRSVAIPLIIKLVNEKLLNAAPALFASKDYIYKQKPIYGSWNVKSLLDTMYIMLYMDITNQTIWRKCANEKCNEFFKVTKENTKKKFHNETCANQQRQRNNRAKKKESE